MSAILAVCGTAFCAMVSDGRMVEEPITDGKIKVLTDALPKVRKLNRNVLVGFAGDAVAAAQIINKLDEYDVQYMTLEKAVKVLQQAAQQTPCAPVGVRLLVGGRGRKGDFQLVMLASAEDYAPQTPEEAWNPLFVEALQKKPYTEYLLDILLSGSLEERKALVAEQRKEVMKLEQRIAEWSADSPLAGAQGGFAAVWCRCCLHRRCRRRSQRTRMGQNRSP